LKGTVILLARQRFAVSAYHAEVHPDRAATEQEMGLVVRVGIRFHRWLDGREVEADAFLDPGADVTVLSLRWVASVAERHAPSTDLLLDGDFIDEDITVRIAERTLLVPRTEIGPQLWSQPGPMAGYEDILLGRDFLVAHRLLLVVDGDERDLSLLLPDDEDNRRRREEVRRVFAPPTSWERLSEEDPFDG
jgi:hypothetical protein